MKKRTRGITFCRILISVITLAFLVVIFADGFSIVSAAASGKTNTTVNIRKTPSKNGETVKKLEKGTAVELGDLVDGKDGDGKKWYKVTVGGVSGYVRSELIDLDDNESNAYTGDVEAVTPVGAKITGSDTVRIRTSADTSTGNNILCTAKKGTEVTVIGRTTGADGKTWYQIKLMVEGKEVAGYVRNDYLAIYGEIQPWDSTSIQENSVENYTDPSQIKRFEVKLINDSWYLLDYENECQYRIDDLLKPGKISDNVPKRYETKYIEGKAAWYLLDYDAEQQFNVEELFAAANSSVENKVALDKANESIEEYRKKYEVAAEEIEDQEEELRLVRIRARRMNEMVLILTCICVLCLAAVCIIIPDLIKTKRKKG